MDRIYFKQLDSLRFFAFLIVFISHATIFLGYENSTQAFRFFREIFLVNGDFGVVFFFVISGFLITTLLFREQKTRGAIQIGNFYMRRILRIWPLYFLILFLGFYIIPTFVAPYFLNPPFSIVPPFFNIWLYLFFAANIDVANQLATSLVIAVLWSISVEEQFYLLWPWVVSYVRERYFLWFLIILITISFLFRLHVADNMFFYKFLSLSVFSDLAVGALTAYLVIKSEVVTWIKNFSKRAITLIYLGALLGVVTRGIIVIYSIPHTQYFLAGVLPLFYSIIFALIILEQEYSDKSFWKVGNWKWTQYLGKRSYGLYCYHMIAILLILVAMKASKFEPIKESFYLWVFAAFCSFFITILLSLFSFRFLEAPFLKLKDRFSRYG